MMAEKASLFQDHRAAELNMSSTDTREHKRTGRGVHKFDCAIWDRVREDAVLAGTFTTLTQNPVVKQHLLGTVTKRLAEASPFDPLCGASGSGRTTPRPKTPAGGEQPDFSGKIFSPFTTPSVQVRPADTPVSSHQTCTPTLPDGIREITVPPSPFGFDLRLPRSSSELFGLFADTPTDHCPEVFAVASGIDPSFALSEHGSSLVSGTTTLDEVSFNTAFVTPWALNSRHAGPAGPTLC